LLYAGRPTEISRILSRRDIPLVDNFFVVQAAGTEAMFADLGHFSQRSIQVRSMYTYAEDCRLSTFYIQKPVGNDVTISVHRYDTLLI
jgi:hypothetical protein